MTQCIVCSQPLDRVQHEGVVLDACPAGHGLWVDRQELVQLASGEGAARSDGERQAEINAARGGGLRAVMDAVSAEGTRSCPACGTGMQKYQYAEYSAIVVDSCAEHGIWLDAGELERVEAYAEGFRRGMVATAPAGLPSSGLLQGLARG